MKFASFAVLALGAAAQKLSIHLYYESQCPGCRDTITRSFANAFEHRDLLKMADISLFPYGNAHEYPNGDSWVFVCQHGEAECEYNIMEVCAQHYIADPYLQFDFIDCIETIDTNTAYDQNLNTCLNYLNISQIVGDDIRSCWSGSNSNMGN